MKKLTASIFIFCLGLCLIAATPIQTIPQSAIYTGIDNTTGNAAAPYVDHTTGALTVTGISSSGVVAPTSAFGVPYVSSEGIAATYRATVSDLAPAASATDVTTICGSATKTVKVKYVQASADSTAAASLDFYVFLRTAVDTGGTSSIVVSTSADPTNDPASTAVVRSYTANPSALGTGVMIIGDHYAMPAATSTGYPVTQWMETFGTRNGKPLTLRGINQCVTFGFNGQAIPAGTIMYANWEWTEE